MKVRKGYTKAEVGKEQYQSGKIERAAGVIRNGGIIAALIGLLFSEPLLAAGVLAVASGEVLRRSQKKDK